MSEADKEIDIEELKEALKLWIKKWKQEREVTIDEKEKIKLTSEIFLAQWIINSKKGYGVDITRILREDKNRGVIKMSNKTSDKNVGSIEDDVKIVKRYLENSAYKESNSNFFKNGGWEIVDLEIPKAMANILAEREQDKKRIKELEADLYSANEIISDLIDNIPKQVVIDLIENETIDISGFECIAVEDLQKLLGGKNENRI